MNNTIDVQDEVSTPLNHDRLRQAAATVLKQQNAAPQSSLSIVITEDARVHELNRDYRNTDSVTDILSFPSDVPPELQEDEPYLGDLIIAWGYASKQAEALGFDLNDNFALLVVHGTLHLLGYDHDTPENRAAMWEAQARALDILNINESMVPLLEETPEDENHS